MWAGEQKKFLRIKQKGKGKRMLEDYCQARKYHMRFVRGFSFGWTTASAFQTLSQKSDPASQYCNVKHSLNTTMRNNQINHDI
jgi:hypothetical protein